MDRKICVRANPWLMGLVPSDVARKQEIHSNKRMLTFVTTLLFITILLWPSEKNVQPPGEKQMQYVYLRVSATMFLLSLANMSVDVGAD